MEHARRAEIHKPKTPAEMARAAHDLVRRGFSDHTIAAILKLDVNMVREMIGERRA